jgi:hypothetical protein
MFIAGPHSCVVLFVSVVLLVSRQPLRGLGDSVAGHSSSKQLLLPSPSLVVRWVPRVFVDAAGSAIFAGPAQRFHRAALARIVAMLARRVPHAAVRVKAIGTHADGLGVHFHLPNVVVVLPPLGDLGQGPLLL